MTDTQPISDAETRLVKASGHKAPVPTRRGWAVLVPLAGHGDLWEIDIFANWTDAAEARRAYWEDGAAAPETPREAG